MIEGYSELYEECEVQYANMILASVFQLIQLLVAERHKYDIANRDFLMILFIMEFQTLSV